MLHLVLAVFKKKLLLQANYTDFVANMLSDCFVAFQADLTAQVNESENAVEPSAKSEMMGGFYRVKIFTWDMRMR